MQLTSLISTSSNGTCCFPKGAVKQGGGHNPVPQRQEEREFLRSLAPPPMAAVSDLISTLHHSCLTCTSRRCSKRSCIIS